MCTTASARTTSPSRVQRYGNRPLKTRQVLTTEESYTSQTSFVNNEALRTISEERRLAKRASKKSSGPTAAVAPAPAQASATLEPGAAKAAPMGKRLKHERHTFVNTHQTGRWARVHAEVTAAFNLLRKVFRENGRHAGLTLRYTVLRTSPRRAPPAAQV